MENAEGFIKAERARFKELLSKAIKCGQLKESDLGMYGSISNKMDEYLGMIKKGGNADIVAMCMAVALEIEVNVDEDSPLAIICGDSLWGYDIPLAGITSYE